MPPRNKDPSPIPSVQPRSTIAAFALRRWIHQKSAIRTRIPANRANPVPGTLIMDLFRHRRVHPNGVSVLDPDLEIHSSGSLTARYPSWHLASITLD